MPVYNGENYIKDAIDSVLNQSLKDFVLIIVNDGSTDQTEQIILSYTDSRIKYYKNECNKGLTYSRNRLISLAETKYVAFLDSDDIALPERFKLQYNYLENNPSVDLVSGSMISFDETGKENKNNFNFELNAEELKTHLLFYNPISTSTVFLRKNSLNGLSFRDSYPPCEDFDLWTRLIQNGNAVVLKNYFAKYRLHQNNISKLKFEIANKNRDRIIENQLAYYFNNQLDEQYKNMHFLLIDLSRKCSLSDLDNIYKYCLYLKEYNKKYQLFNQTSLMNILFERILKRCLRLETYNFSVISKFNAIKTLTQPKFKFINFIKQMVIYLSAITSKNILTIAQ